MTKTMTATAHPQLTPRQRAREIAFQFLFKFESVQLTTAAQAEADFEKHAAHFSIPAECHDFALRLVRTTIQSITAIDEMIKKHAENWRLER